MTGIMSVEDMRSSDAATIAGGVTGRELMARAGKAIYEAVMWKAPVAIVCGVGNNAGDGYVLAGLLKDAGTDCTLVLLEERFSEDGRYYFEECVKREESVKTYETGDAGNAGANAMPAGDGSAERKSGKINIYNIDEIDALSGFGTVVDCIFGTGFKGEVKGKAQDAIDMINESGAYVVSVDINSGLNGDSGMAGKREMAEIPADMSKAGAAGVGTIKPYTCVYSDLTISIGTFKPGHFLNLAKDVMKRKINVDIGIKPLSEEIFLLEESDVAGFLGKRPNFSNKGTYGYTALIGGSKRYSGAVRLAGMANAAMRAGAGVVKVALPGALYHDLLPLILESTVFPLSDRDGEAVFNEAELAELVANVKTVAFGMGIGVSEETLKILMYLLKNYKGRLIIDADGLTLLSRMDRSVLKSTAGQVVLTPHLKEFERLTGKRIDEILVSPIDTARAYASETNTVVLLKGPSTIITDGRVTYITDAGCPGMATAGSGDVLSGILSAVCANGELVRAVAAGAYINGKAGELAQEKYGAVSMVASDTVGCIPEVIRPFETV
ncbi:MAG: NAD(P)H-hydrate dehydratase [Lachnospiraceae bacterium]|nr:NAD(P)H-hydrate dehydratase [Lachnospiraceae bacterium]